MRSDLKEKTIRNFKGLNAGRVSSVKLESFGPAEDQLAQMSNFNVHPNGFLERRPGARELCTLPASITNAGCRIVGVQRGSYLSFSAVDQNLYLIVTDQVKTWRVNIKDGSWAELTYGQGTSITDLQWTAEYGGSSQPYWCYGVRQNGTLSPTAGGIIQINPDKNNMETNTGYQGNTPVGTFVTLFKDRLFVINTNGSTQQAGYETKVWFSEVGQPTNFGEPHLGFVA
jgi:hypothetical protein